MIRQYKRWNPVRSLHRGSIPPHSPRVEGGVRHAGPNEQLNYYVEVNNPSTRQPVNSYFSLAYLRRIERSREFDFYGISSVIKIWSKVHRPSYWPETLAAG